jgi:hypothetical protein
MTDAIENIRNHILYFMEKKNLMFGTKKLGNKNIWGKIII